MSKTIVPIATSTLEEMISHAVEAIDRGADLVELRLDALDSYTIDWDQLSQVLPQKRWIATLRSVAEGGECDLSWEERKRISGQAVAAGAVIDVELRDAEHLADFVNELEESSVEVIVSFHDFDGFPDDIAERVDLIQKPFRRKVIPKVACKCTDIRQNFTTLELVRSQNGRGIAICMGEKGLLSRVLARKTGAFGTFCPLTDDSGTAPGQVTFAQLKQRYNWDRQGSETRVFGVIGSPVGHSLSPAVFNDQFTRAGFNGVYLPLLADSPEELKGFLDGCRERDWLNIGGFSITVPHKETAMQWAGKSVDPLTRRIGAVNTLAFSGGQASACNTDYAGVVSALDAVTGGRGNWRGMTVAVLGAGGVARAAVAGLVDSGCQVTIYNRSQARAENLARDFDCKVRRWEERTRFTEQILVNCTTVGMLPKVDNSPLPEGVLRSGVIVFDTVYNPNQTRLLKEARSLGCSTASGVDMFVHQAAAQYRIWTGSQPDIERMKQLMVNLLS